MLALLLQQYKVKVINFGEGQEVKEMHRRTLMDSLHCKDFETWIKGEFWTPEIE